MLNHYSYYYCYDYTGYQSKANAALTTATP